LSKNDTNINNNSTSNNNITKIDDNEEEIQFNDILNENPSFFNFDIGGKDNSQSLNFLV